jgi:hypothetical protein
MENQTAAPVAKKAAPVAKFPRTEAQREEQGATRLRRSQRSGLKLNFEVYGEIPGYHLHGVVDDGGELQAALQDGYEFVKPGEVGFSSRGGDIKEAGDRVSTYGGQNANNQPYQVYLMKMKNERWEELQAERLEADREVLASVCEGGVSPFSGQYKPSMQTTVKNQ